MIIRQRKTAKQTALLEESLRVSKNGSMLPNPKKKLKDGNHLFLSIDLYFLKATKKRLKRQKLLFATEGDVQMAMKMERTAAPRLTANPRRAALVEASQEANLGIYLFSFSTINYVGF